MCHTTCVMVPSGCADVQTLRPFKLSPSSAAGDVGDGGSRPGGVERVERFSDAAGDGTGEGKGDR